MIKPVFLPTLFFVALMFFSCQSNSQQSNSAAQEKAPDVAETPLPVSRILGPAEFEAKLAEKPNAQLVDVRTEAEVARGYIDNAMVIDIQSQDFKDQIGTLDRAKPVFVYCAKGGRSGNAAEVLKKMGFQEIYDLKGGFTQWSAENKPVKIPGR